MRILISSACGFNYRDIGLLAMSNHIKYACKHSYEYNMYWHEFKESLEMYSNVHFTFLRANLPKYDFIMTCDADTLFVNMEKRLEAVFDGKGQQIATEHLGGSTHNNGVMFWGNCRSSYDLIDAILRDREESIKMPHNWQSQIANWIRDNNPLITDTKCVSPHVQNAYWDSRHGSGVQPDDLMVHFYMAGDKESKLEKMRAYVQEH